jgi:hypothetical protein
MDSPGPTRPSTASPIGPFVGFNNEWHRFYVASVVINAANGRYYEPAPGRNMYVGVSLGAGE